VGLDGAQPGQRDVAAVGLDPEGAGPVGSASLLRSLVRGWLVEPVR